MALKFLNKKGWHTGSLRNIENVWKAEQKRDAEDKKLEELRKQIQEERERTEFRRLQEQAGLVPKQERLDFLYDSGLSVGRPANSEGFKELEAFPKNAAAAAAAPSSSVSASAQQASAPGALFEEKPQSANDAWRKLHSDPLLMIRQREQEALARIKNNPVKMAMILKSVDPKKDKEKKRDKKEKHKKHHSRTKHHKHSSSRRQSDSVDDIAENTRSKMDKYNGPDSEEDGDRRKKSKDFKYRDKSPSVPSRQNNSKDHNRDADGRYYDKSRHERYCSEGQRNSSATHNKDGNGERDRRIIREVSTTGSSVTELHHESRYKRKNIAPKLTDEERAARSKEMQLAAELHEEQRWKRLKKADEEDAREVLNTSSVSAGKNFLESAQKSVYGAEKGGSSTIAESVRRRTHYLQGRSEASEGNAFRR